MTVKKEKIQPHSAVINQISQLKSLIYELRDVTLKNLNEKFKTFENRSLNNEILEKYQSNYQKLREELSRQIKKELESLELGLEQFNHYENVISSIKEIKSHILKDLNTEFNRFKQIFENIKSKISHIFDEQLKTSPLKSFVETIVSDIVSEEFNQIRQFERRFAMKIDDTINKRLEKLSDISKTPRISSFSEKETAQKISKGLINALKESESKFSEVQNVILDSYKVFKQSFLKETYETEQNDIYDKILNHIDNLEKTMQDFLNKVK
ncbi:MAG: hypothetical protein HWN67_22405 [Candidatus Helarchaeota archaeon]|nr:hypothetical protein [Candidatus Helarchaeota archaeon]